MRQDTESILSELWADVLGLEDTPGTDADFLDLGGTSLKATRLLQMIEQRFGTRVAMVELFLAPTLGELAATLDAQIEAKTTAPEAARAAVTKTGEDSALFATLRQLTKDWSGVRTDPESLVIGRNTQASGAPLFWVFNELADFERFMREVPPDQAVYAMRSHARLDLDDEATIQAMAHRYLEEIERIAPDGPVNLGGNCTGAAVALAIGQHLQRRRRHVPVLVLMEWWNELQTYPGRVSLIFGRDSELANPWKYFEQPEVAWGRHFPDYETHIIPGDHGRFFEEDTIGPLWSAVAASIANAKDRPPYLLPDDARRVSLQASFAGEALATGQAVPVQVTVTNASPVTWPDGASMGLVLIGQLFDAKSGDPLGPAHRVHLPGLVAGTSSEVDMELAAVDRTGPAVASFEIAEEGFPTLLWRPYKLELPVVFSDAARVAENRDASTKASAHAKQTRASEAQPDISDAAAAAERSRRAFAQGNEIGAARMAGELVSAADSVLLDYAEGLLGSGKTDAALRRFRQALIVAPNDPRALSGLGRALADQGKFREAQKALDKAFELSETKPVDLVQRRLDVLKKLNDIAVVDPSASRLKRKALQVLSLKRVAQRNAAISAFFAGLPDDVRSKRLVMRMEIDELVSARRFRDVEEITKRYAALFPASSYPLEEAVQKLAAMKQGKIAENILALIEQGNGIAQVTVMAKCHLAAMNEDAAQLTALWGEAVTLNEQRRLDADNGPLRVCLFVGRNLNRLGATDEAVEVLEAGIGIMPDRAELRALLGEIFLKRGDPGKGEEAFRAALSLAQEPERIWTHWVNAALRQVSPAAAREVCSEALQNLPESDALIALRSELPQAS